VQVKANRFRGGWLSIGDQALILKYLAFFITYDLPIRIFFQIQNPLMAWRHNTEMNMEMSITFSRPIRSGLQRQH
jgi:hypothetical protein